MSEQAQELDRKDLKVLAYRQKLSELEEKYNELQVDYTILSDQLQKTVAELEKVNAPSETAEKAPSAPAPAGDVLTD